jgi:fermentation-respiration switch protein FrsA (DUF1100 family)
MKTFVLLSASRLLAALSSKSPALAWAFRGVFVLCLAYVVLIGVLYFMQDSLIFPGHVFQGKSFARYDPQPGTELISLSTPKGERVAALFGEALSPKGEPLPEAAQRPTILYLYGNGQCLNYAQEELDLFRRLGTDVLVPDYLGYGLSAGKPGESGCYAAADAAYAYLTRDRGVQPGKLYIVGWSLGGAVAIDLAAREPAAGLATFSTFTSMEEMAKRQYPYLPVSWFLRSRFESEAKMPRVSCPVLLGHGERDRRVPFDMEERLARAVKTKATRFSVKDAGHNDFYVTGRDQIVREMGVFIRSDLKSR